MTQDETTDLTRTSALEPAGPRLGVGGRLRRVLLSEHFVLYLSVLYFAVLLPFIPRLASPANLANVLSNLWPLFAVAVGQTVVLIVAGIDLSQTSIMAVASVVGGLFMATELNPLLFEKSPLWGVMLSAEGGLLAGSALAVPVGVLAMLVAGTLVGLVNGVAVARFKMPPFMVTLASLIFFSAFALYLTQSENLTVYRDGYVALGRGGVGPVSWAFVAAALLGLAAHVLLARTVPGRWLYAVGRSERTSAASGVPVERIRIFAYAFSGFCAAAAAVLYSARLEAGRPTLGQNLLLDIIGATVIGGTSLFGGKGKVLWTLYGVLFFVLLANTLNLLGLSYFTIDIVKGSVILLAALLDVLRNRLR